MGAGVGGVEGTVGSVAELNCTIQELDCFFLFHQHHAAWGTFPLICVGVGGWIYIDHSRDGLFFLFHQHLAVCTWWWWWGLGDHHWIAPFYH